MKKITRILAIFLLTASAYLNTNAQCGNQKAINLNGTTNYIYVNQPLIDGYPFTISAWVKAGNFVNSREDMVIAGLADSNENNTQYGLMINKRNGKVTIRTRLANGNSHVKKDRTGTTVINNGQWHYIVGVYTATHIKLYVDGDLEASAAHTVGFDQDVNNWNFGRWGDKTPKSYLNGKIASIEIFDAALSADQVVSQMYKRTYDNNALYTNLVGSYIFNAGLGNTVTDYSSTQKNATINGGTWANDFPKYGISDNSLEFDGINDRVVVQDGTGGHPVGNSPLDIRYEGTVEAWIYIKSYKNNAGIVHKGNSVTFQDESYSLQFGEAGWLNSTNKQIVFVVGKNKHTYNYAVSPKRLSLNTWYHVTGVWNRDSIKVYINGKWSAGRKNNLVARKSNASLNIGAQFNRNTNNIPFHGYINEVRLWGTDLTVTQVRERMYKDIDGTDQLWNDLNGYWKFDMGTGNHAFDYSENGQYGVLTSGPTWKCGLSNGQKTAFVSPSRHAWKGGKVNNELDWNDPENWFGGWVPNNTTDVTIPAGKTHYPEIKGNGQCRNLKIDSAAIFTLSNNAEFTISGDLEIKGQFRLKSSTSNVASIITTGNVKGEAVVERFVEADGWHYVSSPVANALSNTFWHSALYEYDEPTATWVPISANKTLRSMKGYDTYYKTNDVIVEYVGQFNSGDFSTALTRGYDGWNYVGNPYPSAIDWDATNGWTKTNVNNAVYIWDPATQTVSSYVNGVGTNGGSNIIPATQAFWVVCNNVSGGYLAVNNDARVHNTQTSFRSRKSDNEVRVSLSTGEYTDETVIRFSENATEYFDPQWDAYKMFGYNINVPHIYTKSTDFEEVAVNSMPDFESDQSVVMNTRIGTNGTHTLNINFEGLSANMDVILEDKQNNLFWDFKQGPYQFEANVGDNEERFVLHFTVQAGISTPTSVNEEENNVNIYSYENSVYIHSDEIINGDITIYNLNGQKVYEERINNNVEKIDLNVASSYYIVNLVSNGSVMSKKLYIE